MQKSKIILGIDPGTVIMGYSVLAVQGRDLRMVEMDVLKLGSKKDMFDRLGLINKRMQELIDQYQPTHVAIEAPFFGKNVQSMLKLGRAQGVAIAVAMSNAIPVAEYSPKKIKQSITGNGNGNKEQVWKMLCKIMPLNESITYFDASDALAVAVCHHFHDQGVRKAISSSSPKKSSSVKKGGWEAFIRDHPDRVNRK